MANYEFTHTINGKAVKGERFFDVFNPATGQVFAKCPDATKAQLNEAIAGAKSITLTHLDEKPFLSLLYSPLGHDYTMIDFKGIIHAYVKEMNWKHFLHNLSFP